MGKKIVLLAGVLFMLLSCEKVKEPIDTSGNLKKYPTGESFATDVVPVLQGTCGLCHSDPADKDLTTASGAFDVFQANGLNKLPSQPTALITDSVNYWKQADSLVNKSAFYLFMQGAHKSRASFTTAQSDKIYGWIIEGGANN